MTIEQMKKMPELAGRVVLAHKAKVDMNNIDFIAIWSGKDDRCEYYTLVAPEYLNPYMIYQGYGERLACFTKVELYEPEESTMLVELDETTEVRIHIDQDGEGFFADAHFLNGKTAWESVNHFHLAELALCEAERMLKIKALEGTLKFQE